MPCGYLFQETFELMFNALDPVFFEGLVTGLISSYVVDDDDSEDSE